MSRFQLISEQRAEELCRLFDGGGGDTAAWIEAVRKEIPPKKRISYGRYSLIKKAGEMLTEKRASRLGELCRWGEDLFGNREADPFVRSFGMNLISLYGAGTGDLPPVLVLMEQAAGDDSWEVRECTAGFVRRLIPLYTEPMHQWYCRMAVSEDPKKRRFASESLRPVADNQWFKRNPEFAWSILEQLFQEPAAYPRTSVGNSLSDWMLIDQERTLPVVRRLAASGNPHSHWIAYRACRNLVKAEPDLVMDLLGVDEYRYKDRRYRR